MCDYFYRVHVRLMDPDPDERPELTFDFEDKQKGIIFSEMAYMAGDMYKVWMEIVTNEVDTTESPMWRKFK